MITFWLIGNNIFPEDWAFSISLIQSILLLSSLCIGTMILIYAGMMYKLNTISGKIWILLGLGMLGWFLGELIYTYYDLFTAEAPFPSIADFFYLIAYLPLSIGLIIQMRLIKIKLSKLEIIIVLILYIIICILVSLFVIIFPIQDTYNWSIPSEDIIPLLISMSYPIVDLILLFFTMFVLAKLRHGKISIAWLLMLIGLIFTILADILFNWVENVVSETQLFELYDLIFLIGYIFICLSGLSIINVMSKSFVEK